MTTLPAPATIADFHARYPAPLTLQSAARILIERSGSSSRFEHLQIYRVLSVPQHSTPHAALNFAANTALCSQLQLFPSARELLDAGPDAMVDAGCSHIFYSALADLLREADDSRISARHQPVTPAKQGLSPSCPTRPVDASAYGSTPYKAPRFLPLPSFARPRVLPQARIVPNQLTLSMVSPFLLVVLSLRDQVPAQRLRFSLYPRRTQVVTRAGRFESEDNGGFEFIGRDCTDHRAGM
ncbi:hypothetical protein FN846DRAFT_949624 [Sphaerosporella brunnea]|uniref:Uncharacterized protein n=1 Tax=Sphaerosporella brunnea TaxID=1250544 RepID=A0A5J5EWW6_9PEZI|nr:hypothetical protein FN846DRAFT_949624 [Sphaerosporella brunnea]